MSIGQKIKELRESKNITQAELANRADVTQNAISLIENGSREPTFRTLEKIAEATDTKLWIEFVGGPKC